MLTRIATRLFAVLLVVTLIGAALHGPYTAQAQPAQTPKATLEATPEPQATKFPPCPPVDEAELPEATEEPTPQVTPTITPTFDTRAEFAPGYLGIAAEDVADCGSRVIEIISGSPADRAGLQLGDVIVAADGVPRRSATELRNYILSRPAGQSVLLVVKRDDQELEIRVVLGMRPRITPPTVTPTPTEPEPTPAATEGN
jgi:predicted metalloprotease with PDZ domain